MNRRWVLLTSLLELAGCGPDAAESTEPAPPFATGLDASAGSVEASDARSEAGGGSGPGVSTARTDGAVASSIDATASLSEAGVVTADARVEAGGGTPTGSPRDAGSDATTGPGRTDAASAGSPRVHVFLLLGQSNMAGYPKAQAADKLEEPRIRVLGYDECAATGRHKDAWDTAAPPLHECGIGAIGPGDSFAKSLLETLPAGDTIGLVPCAISGEKIETFMKIGGAKYSWIVQRAKLAQAMGTIDGILFHQGESNCGDRNWPGKVKTLVTDLRTDLGLGEVAFLAGELAATGACTNHNPLVNQLPSLITNGHVVSAEGLVLDPADTQWHLHFSHDSQLTLGKRYAKAMIELLH